MNLLIGQSPSPPSVISWSRSWCLPEGNYRLKLNDKNLFEFRHKHAAIRIADTRHEDQSHPAPYISGSGSIYFSLGQPSIYWVSDVNWYLQIGFYSLVAVLVTIAVVSYMRYKSSTEGAGSEAAGAASGERSPLIAPRGAVELSRA
jgi:hypothetical protein